MSFQPGEIINVQIKGVRYVRDHGAAGVQVETDEDEPRRWTLPPQAALERVAPKEWPPQPGDIWANGLGYEWIGMAGGDLHGVDTAEQATFNVVNRRSGPLRLVRRRGWTPAEPAAAEDAEPEADERAACVAGLRALAAAIEAHPELPVPTNPNAQIGFHGAQGLTEAQLLAAEFGIELEPPRNTGNDYQRWARPGYVAFGGGVTLTLYAHGLDAPEPVDCCPDADPEATS